MIFGLWLGLDIHYPLPRAGSNILREGSTSCNAQSVELTYIAKMRFRRTRSLIISGVVLAVICLQHVYRRSTCTITTVQRISQDQENPMQVEQPRMRGATSKPTETTTSQERYDISG